MITSQPFTTGHPCIRFIKGYSFHLIMDTQANLFRYLNQQETDSSQTIAYPLVGGAKKTRQNARLKLDEEEVVRLYQQGLSQRMIADRYYCSPPVISRILKENNIRIRTESETKKILFKNGILIPFWRGKNLPKEIIFKLKKPKNKDLIAKSANTQRRLHKEGKIKIWNKNLSGIDYLKHYKTNQVWNKGLTKLNSPKIKIMGEKIKIKLDKKLIKELYIDDDMSSRQISKIIGCSTFPILNVLKEMNVPLKTASHNLKKLHKKLKEANPKLYTYNQGKFFRQLKKQGKLKEFTKKAFISLYKKYGHEHFVKLGIKGGLNSVKSRRKKYPYTFMGNNFDSNDEKKIAQYLYEKGIEQTFIENKNIHIKIGNKEIDFFIQKKVFLEYHPYDFDGRNDEEYLKSRLKAINNSVYSGIPLILIKNIDEIKKLDEIFNITKK